jgi:predicted aspartyl protease
MRSIVAVTAVALLSCLLVMLSSSNLSGTHTRSAPSPVPVPSAPVPVVPSLVLSSAQEGKTAERQAGVLDRRKGGVTRDESTDLESLYKSREWFELRDAVRASNAPAFYRGAVACGFGDLQEARQQFTSVIKSAPKSEKAYQSRNMLAYLYFRTGQYRHALKEIDQMLMIRPDNASDQAGRKLYMALSQSPEQSVTRQRVSRLPYEVKIGDPFIPLSVNGNVVKYLLDTGANISVMSESEAKRVGLTFHQVPVSASKIRGSSGAQSQSSYRIAVAEQVVVGQFHLSHVAFLVLPDDQEPWTDLRLGERGALGISVLHAFRTVRFSNEGIFEIGFPSKPQVQQSNLCFQDAYPIVEAELFTRRLRLALDTGAAETHLTVRFAKEFEGLLNDGKKSTRDVLGVDGSRRIEAVTLQELRFQVGGFNTLLRPAQVLLSTTNPDIDDFYGLLGWDLLSQARSITLDFDSMTLALE